MKVRILRTGSNAVAEAAREIENGGVVAIPTDTVYGLACDPSSDDAVSALFKAKGRVAKPVPLLCAGLRVAQELVVLNVAARKLASTHWPGALTIVAPLKNKAKVSSLVHQGTGYLGVRVPKSEFCVNLAAKVGGSITGTSANVSGRPSCRNAQEAAEALSGKIGLVIDGGELMGRESTVVKVSGATVEVLRKGSVGILEGEPKR